MIPAFRVFALALALSSGRPWYLYVPVVGLCAIALLHERATDSVWVWAAICGALTLHLALDWADVDNHRFLFALQFILSRWILYADHS